MAEYVLRPAPTPLITPWDALHGNNLPVFNAMRPQIAIIFLGFSFAAHASGDPLLVLTVPLPMASLVVAWIMAIVLKAPPGPRLAFVGALAALSLVLSILLELPVSTFGEPRAVHGILLLLTFTTWATCVLFYRVRRKA